jgi:hypothetical protein
MEIPMSNNMPLRPQTRPEGVSAGDYDTHDAPRQPVKQFRGGASYDTSGEYVRHPHHATSEGAVAIPPAPPGARLSFKSESGQQILAKNAGLHDRVTVPGAWGESTIGAALHAGAIIELPGGGYDLPDAVAAPGGDPAGQADQRQAEPPVEQQAPQQDLLPPAQEALPASLPSRR